MIWHNGTSGEAGVAAQGSLTIRGSKLYVAGGLKSSPACYDLKTGEYVLRRFRYTRNGFEIGVLPSGEILFGGRELFTYNKRILYAQEITIGWYAVAITPWSLQS